MAGNPTWVVCFFTSLDKLGVSPPKETLIQSERSPAAAKAVMILQAVRTASRLFPSKTGLDQSFPSEE